MYRDPVERCETSIEDGDAWVLWCAATRGEQGLRKTDG
jgi:hypothetical protein